MVKKIQWLILQQITGRKRAMLSGFVLTSFWHFADVSLRFHDIRRCNVIFLAYNIRNACKRQHYSQNCWRDFFIWRREVGRIWRIQLLFRRFLWNEIDQPLYVIFWVINHSLLVSCKINHSRSTLMNWSTLQLTSKQRFIIQQITATADLFLNPCLLNPDMPCLCKECSSRLVGFWTDLDLHCLSLSMYICSNFWIKWSDWLKLRNGCGIFIHSAWQE